MAAPLKWDWSASNGSATAEETAAAYNALTHPQSNAGRISYFKATVWDDIISKISEMRLYWGGTSWDSIVANIEDSKMIADHAMSAVRFNSAVANYPFSNRTWAWEARLRRKIINPGDACAGAYFLDLTDAINAWLDLEPLDITATLRMMYSGSLTPDLLIVIDTKPESSMYKLLTNVKAALTTASEIKVDEHFKLTTKADMWCGYIDWLVSAVFYLFSYSAVAQTPRVRHIIADKPMQFQSLAQAFPAVGAPTGSQLDVRWLKDCTAILRQDAHIIAEWAGLFECSGAAVAPYGVSMVPAPLEFLLRMQGRAYDPLSCPFAATLPTMRYWVKAAANIAQAVPLAGSLIFPQSTVSCLAVVRQSMNMSGFASFIFSEQGAAVTLPSLPFFPLSISHALWIQGTVSGPLSHSFAAIVPPFTLQTEAAANIAQAVPVLAALTGGSSTALQITLPVVSWLTGACTGFFEGLVNVAVNPSMPSAGSAESTTTANCTISMGVFVLASELDDVLASELDDMLVDNVEYTII